MENCLRELRERRNWTQSELAKHLEVSRETVNHVETNRNDPSLALAFRISAVLDLPIDAIFRPSLDHAKATKSRRGRPPKS